jgi:hypothetical protein
MNIEAFASDIARQMKMTLSDITLTDGLGFGCLDCCILDMTERGKTVGTLIYKNDIEKLDNSKDSARLEVRIRASLCRLQTMLED